MSLIEARRAFGDLPVAHLATTLPDGSPHVVPLWFVWRGEAIYVSCRRDSATWRNVERDRRVALSFDLGLSWQELRGAVIHGRAEPLAPDHPSLREVLSAWYTKYRRLLGGGGFRDYAERVEDPGMFRVRPERMTAWNHAARSLGRLANPLTF
ncbi:MAG: pyridoxamine 5'-phosphate oxidase family protein [Actinomycetota bacterium]